MSISESGSLVQPSERHVESNIRYFERRAMIELAAARRAVTPEARLRREQLANSFLSQVTEMRQAMAG
jgi:hypothetical protein